MLTLTFQSLLTTVFFAFPAPIFAQESESILAAPTEVNLNYSQETKEFTLFGQSPQELDYLISYQSAGIKKALAGKITGGSFSEIQLAGSCSDNVCVYDTPTGGQIDFPQISQTYYFHFDADNTLWLSKDDIYSVSDLKINTTYSFIEDPRLKISFSQLASPSGQLVFKEVTLTQEQMSKTGAYSSKAYEITSSMLTGSFVYTLELPLPLDANENSRVMYAPSLAEIDHATVITNKKLTPTSIISENLNHFTLFLVTKDQFADCVEGIYSEGNCYDSIQDAIDSVYTKNGDSIQIKPGIYNENISLHKNVSLVGAGIGQDPLTNTIIRQASESAVVTLSASGTSSTQPLTLKNIRIEPTQNAGIEIIDQAIANILLDTISIEGSEPAKDEQIGVKIGKNASVNQLQVINSTFNKLQYGWLLDADDQVKNSSLNNQFIDISNSVFSNNKKVGLFVKKASNFYIHDSTFTNNGQSFVDGSGLTFTASDSAQLQSITLSKNIINNNKHGLINTSPSEINALQNWWGDKSGPADDISTDQSSPLENPTGTGNAVVGFLKYGEWTRGLGKIFIKKLVCEQGIKVGRTSFQTASDSAIVSEENFRPGVDGSIVNGQVPFSEINNDSIPGCTLASGYNFQVLTQPGIKTGIETTTGISESVGTITSDENGEVYLDQLNTSGRLQVKEVYQNNTPIDQKYILGFACYRNNQGHNDSDDDSEYATFNEFNKTYCVAINTPTTQKVSGTQFNDINKNSTKDSGENGLSGWTITAVSPEAVHTIIVNSQDIAGTTIPNLQAGRYLLQAEGAWSNNNSSQEQFDAEYGTTDNWATHSAELDNIGELQINNTFVNWGPYQTSHLYLHMFQQLTAGDFNLGIYDGANNGIKIPSWYFDNNGHITVKIYKIVDQTQTDSNGAYNLEIPVDINSIAIYQSPQAGWIQTYPQNLPIHTVNLLSSPVTELNFGNWFGTADPEVIPSITPTSSTSATPTVLPTATPIPTSPPESANSNNSSANNSSSNSTASPTVCLDTKPDVIPTLNAQVSGANSVILNWNSVNSATHYALFFSDSTGKSYGASYIGNSTSYTVTNLSGANTYSFQIMAVNGCAPGERSNTVNPSGILIGGITLGQPTGNDNQVLGATQQNNITSDSNNENTQVEGSVLGKSIQSCVQWKIYLPIIFLTLQILLTLMTEVLMRAQGASKHITNVVIAGGMLALFYIFKDCPCGSGITWLSFTCTWFTGISLVLLGIIRGIGYLLIEEESN